MKPVDSYIIRNNGEFKFINKHFLNSHFDLHFFRNRKNPIIIYSEDPHEPENSPTWDYYHIYKRNVANLSENPKYDFKIKIYEA